MRTDARKMLDSIFGKAMAVTIGACALSMALLMVKVVGAPIGWIIVMLPALLAIGAWSAVFLAIVAFSLILFILGGD